MMMCLYREPTMYMPLAVGVLSLPIDVGMDFTTSPFTRTVSILVLSSAVAITSSPMVKCVCTLSSPNIPSPKSTP
ncbi:Uncharacterised protein [Mycobacterium tuberculosis]|nr:Uncharacterised protein [Mycobacterium tuberculosis]CKR80175.1 Uncharacterised protein [Mycobacterium tuberculosis]CLA76017.1 Uncharacterised protein [Mycobacterium tuberculosis]COW28699.1 Uncharacterised protein [Mycobacterium tuberculosis]COW92291.1 Uncharacterised protein [Mycobacterium tuberculosis]